MMMATFYSLIERPGFSVMVAYKLNTKRHGPILLTVNRRRYWICGKAVFVLPLSYHSCTVFAAGPCVATSVTAHQMAKATKVQKSQTMWGGEVERWRVLHRCYQSHNQARHEKSGVIIKQKYKRWRHETKIDGGCDWFSSVALQWI